MFLYPVRQMDISRKRVVTRVVDGVGGEWGGRSGQQTARCDKMGGNIYFLHEQD